MIKCLHDNGSIFYDVASFFLGLVELIVDLPCNQQMIAALFLIAVCGLLTLYLLIFNLKRLAGKEL